MRCPRHPDRLALATCTVCGNRHCSDCAPVHPVLGEPVCATCLPGLPPPPPPTEKSAKLLWPVGLLFLGLVVGGVFWLQKAGSEGEVSVSIALKRLEIVGLACERFRAARGAWPETLDDLVPGQLASLPPDPFGGQLRLGPDPLGGGHVVYSLGPDGVDQGGVPRDPVSGAGDLVYPLD